MTQILMRRGMIRVDDGYQYSYDTALRNTQAQRFSEPQYRAILEAIECPVMIIIGAPLHLIPQFSARFLGRHPSHLSSSQSLFAPWVALPTPLTDLLLFPSSHYSLCTSAIPTFDH